MKKVSFFWLLYALNNPSLCAFNNEEHPALKIKSSVSENKDEDEASQLLKSLIKQTPNGDGNIDIQGITLPLDSITILDQIAHKLSPSIGLHYDSCTIKSSGCSLSSFPALLNPTFFENSLFPSEKIDGLHTLFSKAGKQALFSWKKNNINFDTLTQLFFIAFKKNLINSGNLDDVTLLPDEDQCTYDLFYQDTTKYATLADKFEKVLWQDTEEHLNLRKAIGPCAVGNAIPLTEDHFAQLLGYTGIQPEYWTFAFNNIQFTTSNQSPTLLPNGIIVTTLKDFVKALLAPPFQPFPEDGLNEIHSFTSWLSLFKDYKHLNLDKQNCPTESGTTKPLSYSGSSVKMTLSDFSGIPLFISGDFLGLNNSDQNFLNTLNLLCLKSLLPANRTSVYRSGDPVRISPSQRNKKIFNLSIPQNHSDAFKRSLYQPNQIISLRPTHNLQEPIRSLVKYPLRSTY